MDSERQTEETPSLDRKTYYSADSGFAAAAAGRGIPEAVQEHIEIILRNEELEIASSHKQSQEKIKSLENKKKALEENKDECQKEIRAREVEVAKQEATLAELNTKLNASPEAKVVSSPDPVIEDLRDKKDECQQELRSKVVEKAKLEVESKVPLTVEVLKNLVEFTGIDMPKIGFSWKQLFVAGCYTLSLIGLLGYVYIFYTSVAMKAFSPEPEKTVDASSQQTGTDEQTDLSDQQTDPALNQYVDPFAWQRALDNKPSRNYFVLLFPMIFIVFAIALHFCINEFLEANLRKWLNWGAPIFLILTFLFDWTIAYNISQNIEDIKQNIEQDRITEQNATKEAIKTLLQGSEETESVNNEDTASEDGGSVFGNVVAIIFLGFVPSLLLTAGIYTTLESWKKVRPYGEYIKQMEHEYRIDLASIGAEIEGLKNEINSLDTQITERIQADRHPIQIEIGRIETEKKSTEQEIAELNEIVGNIQEDVEKYQTEIDRLENLLKLPEKNPVDTKRMEKHVKEFVTGWCRFIAWQNTELTGNVSDEIKRIQAVANQTLNAYKPTIMGNGRSD